MPIDIPFKDPEQTASIGHEIDVRAALDIDKTDEVRAVHRKETDDLYLVELDGDANTIRLYKGDNVLRNDWTLVSETSKTIAGNGSAPLVTPKGTLLMGFDHSTSPIIMRSEDWETWSEVHSGHAPLHWKHGVDGNGDIYFGGYWQDNSAILKSTDDGQTWSQIADTNADDHIHSLAASDHQDLLCASWGDTNYLFEFYRKDGTPVDTQNPLGQGDSNYRPGAIMDLQDPTGGNARDTFLCASDAPAHSVMRAHAEADGSDNLSYEFEYAVPKLEFMRAGAQFFSDIDIVGRQYVALGMTGALLVSDDGWFWDVVKIPWQNRAKNAYQMNFTKTNKWLVAMGGTLSVVPIDYLQDIRPTSIVYQWVSGEQATSVPTGEFIAYNWPLYKFKEVSCLANDAEPATADLQERTMPNAGNDALNLEPLFDITDAGGGTDQRTITPTGAVSGRVRVSSSESDDDLSASCSFSVVVERR